MEFRLDLLETKIEFFEAINLKSLESQIEKSIDINRALMLDVYSISHQSTFNHRTEKMHFSAVVHFKIKR
ncbi:DUF2536 family protein [Paenibacillus sp. L3-i20]|uniref:DUF2536 family protein n=1 Tax=Paenibacillus sp. L3-i20 TaxID=2905833 RepID=UPI001EDE9550|nr:DUF2536 family protein [Paenibacillus sp. L3-i20]GKU78319.1 hypothetical protein L3i20_v227160 [Paenibacillus sp. L3-i20]